MVGCVVSRSKYKLCTDDARMGKWKYSSEYVSVGRGCMEVWKYGSMKVSVGAVGARMSFTF